MASTSSSQTRSRTSRAIEGAGGETLAQGDGAATETLVGQAEGDDRGTGGDRDVLPPVERVGHGRGFPGGVGREPPARGAGGGVHRGQVAAVVRVEDESAGGGEHAAPGAPVSGLRALPGNGAGADVDRAEDLPARLARGR